MWTELFRPVRPFTEKPVSPSTEPLQTFMLTETGTHDNWHVRTQFTEPMKRFFAVHERHVRSSRTRSKLERC